MLTELRRIILVQPVVVAGEVTLLRDPELDGVVLHLDEVQPRRPEHGDEQRDQDHWHWMGGGPYSEPEGKFNVRNIIYWNYIKNMILPVEESLKLPDNCLFLW